MGATPKFALPYPEPPDPADVPADMHELAQAVEDLGGHAPGFATLGSDGKVPAGQLPSAAATTPPVVLISALPGSPTDGQQVVAVDSLTAPTYGWLLQYLAAASRWLVIGGSGWVEGTNTVTVPRAGDYMCEIGGAGVANGAGAAGAVTVDLSITAGGVALLAVAGQGTGQNNVDYSSCFDKGRMLALTTGQVLTPASTTPPTRRYIRIQAVRLQ